MKDSNIWSEASLMGVRNINVKAPSVTDTTAIAAASVGDSELKAANPLQGLRQLELGLFIV
jgi:hypothetical protein